jgi:hypothetical protein
MWWQQNLGRISPYFKLYANSCSAISWGNYSMVLVINFLFLFFYEFDAERNEY